MEKRPGRAAFRYPQIPFLELLAGVRDGSIPEAAALPGALAIGVAFVGKQRDVRNFRESATGGMGAHGGAGNTSSISGIVCVYAPALGKC